MCAALGKVAALILICAALLSANLPGGRVLPAAVLHSVPASLPTHRPLCRMGRGCRTPLLLPADTVWGLGEMAAPSPSAGEHPRGHGEQHEGPSLSGEMGWFVPPAALMVTTSGCHSGPPGLGGGCAGGHRPHYKDEEGWGTSGASPLQLSPERD